VPLWSFALLLAAGIAIGRRGRLPDRLLALSGRALTVSVYGLIFLIGEGMGAKAGLLGEIGPLALRSVLLALFATLGAALACAGVARLEARRGS